MAADMRFLRPAVTHNIAVALRADGSLGRISHRAPGSMSPGNLARLDRLRAHFDAIMIDERALIGGIGEPCMVASPRLRAQRQAEGRPQQPLNVIVIRDATPLVGSRFLSTCSTNLVQVWICTTEQTAPACVADLRSAGAHVSILGASEVDLAVALQELSSAGIELLFVEGESDLTTALFAQGFVDEVILDIAPVLLMNHDALTPGSIADEYGQFDHVVQLEHTLAQELDDNNLVLYYTVSHTHVGSDSDTL